MQIHRGIHVITKDARTVKDKAFPGYKIMNEEGKQCGEIAG